MRELLRIGAGAGFSGDRLEPAAVLAERGRVQYLVLECLGERTVALAQLRKRRDPARGYDPLLERRVELLLPIAAAARRAPDHATWARPTRIAAADAIIAIARTHKTPIRVAVLTGDDVLDGSIPASSRWKRERRSRATASWSRPMPTSAPRRCCPRCKRAPTSSSPAASPTRRCSSRR